MAQLVMRINAIGTHCTGTDIGFDDDGPTDGIQEFLGGIESGRTDEACGRDTRLLVECLHAGLALDVLHVRTVPSCADVEIRPQTSIALEPVFVVGLDPVDASIFECKKSHGAQHLVIVVECRDKVVLSQCFAHLTP